MFLHVGNLFCLLPSRWVSVQLPGVLTWTSWTDQLLAVGSEYLTNNTEPCICQLTVGHPVNWRSWVVRSEIKDKSIRTSYVCVKQQTRVCITDLSSSRIVERTDILTSSYLSCLRVWNVTPVIITKNKTYSPCGVQIITEVTGVYMFKCRSQSVVSVWRVIQSTAVFPEGNATQDHTGSRLIDRGKH